MDFIAEFHEKVRKYNPDFEVLGFLTRAGEVYPLGSDTKVLSTAFELVVRPLVKELAQEHGLQCVEPTQQNFYPDFTLMENDTDELKVAVDVKTAYRNFQRGGGWTASFTLGSYTSFLRDDTKNIHYPYSSYGSHYIIGFIYTRSDHEVERDCFELERLGQMTSPIKDVEYFVQEKHRISSDRAGSGNTTNIASITGRSIEDFVNGAGPFADQPKAVFEDYWRNYGTRGSERTYRSFSEYRQTRSTD